MHAALKRSVLSLLALAAGSSSSMVMGQDFSVVVKDVLANSQATTLAVPGADPNWLFLRRELEHLDIGDLSTVNLAVVNKEKTDPLPVIAKYAADLKALGVDLLLVPVPPKAAVYPQKLNAGVDVATVPSLVPFYGKLQAAGVEVLDLETLFKAQLAENPDKQLYCATDSHWSPYAAQLVADVVAKKYQALTMPNPSFGVLPEEKLEFLGDLVASGAAAGMAKEVLPMQRAGKVDPAKPGQVETVDSDPRGPIVVIGDSHLQVFRRGGNMLATQAGFIDHLQEKLKLSVEEFSMQAGGADGPRRNLARATAANPEFWANKKVVIWVFTAREFTQGRWKELPVQVKKK